MRITTFSGSTNFAAIQKAAKTAEAQGFDTFGAPEITGDPFIHLAAAAMATERIRLQTVIAVAFPRSPMVTAGSSWALHANTKGRFALGLGTQIKAHNKRRFSVEWVKPRQRMREYVESLHAIWACWENGAPLKYSGDHYQFSLMTPEFSPRPAGLPRIPVYVAAVRSGMQQAVASYADGILLHPFCTQKYLKEVSIPAIEEGLKEAGRERSAFDVTGGGFIATGPNTAAVSNQRAFARYRVAFYGSTPAYRPVMSLHGWDDLSEKLHAMTRAGEWSKMSKAIPDDVLDEFCVAATWDDLPAAIESRFGGLSDTVEIMLDGTEPDQAKVILDKVRAIPAKFQGSGDGW